MSNTTRIYNAVADFMSIRAQSREEFLETAQRYADAKGSRMYDNEMSKARKKREETVAAAQVIARQEIGEILESMAEKADRIKMQPPTVEQLRLLQMLSLREKLTEAELVGAANAMDGNAAALSLVDELAKKSGVVHIPFTSRLSVMAYDPLTARQAIRKLGDACFSIVDNTTGANKMRLQAAEYHKRLYGGDFDPDSFPQEAAFQSESDFYNQVGIPLTAFAAAVD